MKRVLSAIALSLFAAGALVSGQTIPEIPYDSVPNFLKTPDDVYIGEAAGVATNSKGNIFVYTRTGSAVLTLGTERAFVRGNGAARLFEFDPSGKYIREIGQASTASPSPTPCASTRRTTSGWWTKGSNMVIKFTPDGRVAMTMGRKPEALNVPGGPAREGRGGGGAEGGGGGRAAGPVGRGRPWRQLQSANRCRVGFRRQHLRVRRVRQLADREVRQEREVRRNVGIARHRAR
jgi:hypothetical protein